MAEIFGVVSGALSVAGFAGQLAQSAAFLYDFVSDIRGAPKRVQALGKELLILKSILGDIQKSYTGQNADLEQALKYCHSCLNDLLGFVKKIDPDQQTKKRRRLWRQLKVAIKGSDLTKYIGELDRSKSMLLQVCVNILRDEQTGHSKRLEAVAKSAQDLSNDQRASYAVTGTIQSAVEEIRDTSFNVFSTSERVETTTKETDRKTTEVLHNTEQIRAMIERMELATQTLVQERLVHQPEILEALKDELNHAISTNLKPHIEQHFPSSKANQIQGSDGVESSQHPKDIEIVASKPRPCYSRNEESVHTMPDLENPTDQWVKKSSIGSRRDLIRNPTFGTLSVRTTTVSYTRSPAEGLSETKQHSTTIITFLPAAWLLPQGAIIRYQRLQFLSRSGGQIIPHWNLSTVNVIQDDSEILTACVRHDLGTVRKLFDEGRASPYDVDKHGRNLLGHVAVGVQEFGNHDIFQGRLDELDAIIGLLLSLGVDPGSIDLLGGVPIGIFVVCWARTYFHLPIISTQEDRLRFLFRKLLTSAKADPFCSSDAHVAVTPNSKYLLYHFPGCHSKEEVFITQFELLMDQDDWKITLCPHQLHELSSARYLYRSKEIVDVRDHVNLWVTSQAEDAKKYLDTKLGLLRRLLNDRLLYLGPGGDNCVIDALHGAVHNGGEVIALLTEHDHDGSGRYPWIRHRFRKLVLMERWLTEIFKLLLTSGATHIADNPEAMEDLCHHAQEHNARTFCAWMKAVKACIKDQSRLSILCEIKDAAAVSKNENDSKVRTNDGQEEQDSGNQGWETEDTEEEEEPSEWETEEEQEEGYMIELAIDRKNNDARNPQLSDGKRHTCDIRLHDYDEEYWKHLYPRIISSNLDPSPQEHRESRVLRLAKYAKAFISTVV